jgi:UDP-2-acetamido-2-deoxy-ribo-hexuluronate aminotransferase
VIHPKAMIATGVHYPMALSQKPAFAQWAKPTPDAERAAEPVLLLPMDPFLSPPDIEATCTAVRMAQGT